MYIIITYIHRQLLYCSRFVSLGIAFGCDYSFQPRSSSYIMFTHLIYIISNKSLEVLCKRVCLFMRLSLWKDKIKPSLNIQNFKCLSHSLLFDCPLCCSFSFPPFYLSYLYFFRQYIHFHRHFIKSSSQFISALLVKGIAFCCCFCCSYTLFFCLFYFFVPIQLTESASSLSF